MIFFAISCASNKSFNEVNHNNASIEVLNRINFIEYDLNQNKNGKSTRFNLLEGVVAVSYTHLTLPTILLV